VAAGLRTLRFAQRGGGTPRLVHGLERRRPRTSCRAPARSAGPRLHLGRWTPGVHPCGAGAISGRQRHRLNRSSPATHADHSPASHRMLTEAWPHPGSEGGEQHVPRHREPPLAASSSLNRSVRPGRHLGKAALSPVRGIQESEAVCSISSDCHRRPLQSPPCSLRAANRPPIRQQHGGVGPSELDAYVARLWHRSSPASGRIAPCLFE
jgi:hypothetical protein